MYNLPKVQENDWKLFRSRIPGWQEAYMEKLIRGYMKLLSSDKSAADRFWALDKRIRKDQQDYGVQAEMKRSNMRMILMNLLDEGAITQADLDGFSDELRDSLNLYTNHPMDRG